MKCEVSTSSCRICLAESKKVRSIYKPVDDGDEPPAIMLLKITGIRLEEMHQHTMLPKNICKNCELSLSMAFEFRVKALESQVTIETYKRQLNLPLDTEQADSKATQCNLDVDDAKEANSSERKQSKKRKNSLEVKKDFKKFKDELEIALFKTEHFQDDKLDDDIETVSEQNLTTSQSLEEYFVVAEEDANRSEPNVEEEDDELQELNAFEEEHEGTEFIDETEEDTIYELEIDDEYDAEMLKILAKNNSEAKNGSDTASVEAVAQDEKLTKQHICDICGNVFSKRSRLMEHRQRHNTELKYECELCDKKFHMREALRRHMFIHKGGRPYKCDHCSRTFYYESVKKAHEAIHQGLKRFVCGECGKAFAYAHTLQKHKLIHAEVKLYRCECCQKDFRLLHHMKQHQLTKAHKKALAVAAKKDLQSDKVNHIVYEMEEDGADDDSM